MSRCDEIVKSSPSNSLSDRAVACCWCCEKNTHLFCFEPFCYFIVRLKHRTVTVVGNSIFVFQYRFIAAANGKERGGERECVCVTQIIQHSKRMRKKSFIEKESELRSPIHKYVYCKCVVFRCRNSTFQLYLQHWYTLSHIPDAVAAGSADNNVVHRF